MVNQAVIRPASQPVGRSVGRSVSQLVASVPDGWFPWSVK